MEAQQYENDYEAQAQDFLNKTGTEFKVEFLRHDLYFRDDKHKRDIYEITLTRGERSYSFEFGQSLNKSFCKKEFAKADFGQRKEIYNHLKANLWVKVSSEDLNKLYAGHVPLDKLGRKELRIAPTPYDVLACLDAYQYESFEDFCGCMGYDKDSISALEIYNAIKEQVTQLERLYSEEEIALLHDIN